MNTDDLIEQASDAIDKAHREAGQRFALNLPAVAAAGFGDAPSGPVTVTYERHSHVVEWDLATLRHAVPHVEWRETGSRCYQAEDPQRDHTWFARFTADRWAAVPVASEFLTTWPHTVVTEVINTQLDRVLNTPD